jgi:hypothetical protein
MKTTVPLSALAAILGFALTGSPVALQAQTDSSTDSTTPSTTDTTTAPAKTKSKAKSTPYEGTLTAIDPGGDSITVTTAKKTLVMAVTAKTKYKKDAPALTDFAVGDKVTGSYTADESGSLTAYSIHKKPTAANKTDATPATAADSTPPADSIPPSTSPSAQ